MRRSLPRNMTGDVPDQLTIFGLFFFLGAVGDTVFQVGAWGFLSGSALNASSAPSI